MDTCLGSQYSLRNPQVWSYLWSQATHSDTALCLKQMALWVQAQEYRKVPQDVGMLLESPQDPASYLTGDEAALSPSFWNFSEITSWVGVGNLELYHFDQGAFGHPPSPCRMSHCGGHCGPLCLALVHDTACMASHIQGSHRS